MANIEHLQRLGDVLQWNTWRRQERTVQPDLSGADLTERDLSGASLSKVNLAGANLAGANLSGARMGGANMLEANLAKANLTQSGLSGADLSFANLCGAVLCKTDLHGAKLERAKMEDILASISGFDGANMLGANLKRAHLAGSFFPKANLTYSDLDNADLTDANMFRTDLFGASLQGANLTRAVLRHANAGRADLRGANLDSCAVFGLSTWEAKLDGAVATNLLVTDATHFEVRVDGVGLGCVLQLLHSDGMLPRYITELVLDAVLIIGPFLGHESGKPLIDTILEEVRHRGFSPIWCHPISPPPGDPLRSKAPDESRQYDPQFIRETIALVAPLAKLTIIDGDEQTSRTGLGALRQGSHWVVLKEGHHARINEIEAGVVTDSGPLMRKEFEERLRARLQGL